MNFFVYSKRLLKNAIYILSSSNCFNPLSDTQSGTTTLFLPYTSNSDIPRQKSIKIILVSEFIILPYMNIHELINPADIAGETEHRAFSSNAKKARLPFQNSLLRINISTSFSFMIFSLPFVCICKPVITFLNGC